MNIKYILSLIAALATLSLSAQPNTATAWVNEFHYDGLSTYGTEDANEFVELIILKTIADNPTELAKFQLVLYTSGGTDQFVNTTVGRGLPYDQTGPLYSAAETYFQLSTSSPDGSSGFQRCDIPGTDYTALYRQLPTLQDIPAAFGIIYDNTTLVQLVSYEKSFKIKDDASKAGAAAGQTTELMVNSLNAAVQESASSLNTHSIQLQGTGSQYDDFTWSDLIINTASPCNANANQTFEASSLPVEWLAFKVSVTGATTATLQWITASEKENTGFVVERSTDGKQFEKIGWVEGSGTTSTQRKYELKDANLVPNLSYFYRLRQVDIDGNFSYSPIRQIFVPGAKDIAIGDLFPNPIRATDATAALQLYSPAATELYVEIVDSKGSRKEAFTRTLVEGTSVLSLPVQDLAAGHYFIKLQSSQTTTYRKLIVK